MITKIELKGFKSYVDYTFELKPLTILTGLNSSGKSSVIQAIRMMENIASREYVILMSGILGLDRMPNL